MRIGHPAYDVWGRYAPTFGTNNRNRSLKGGFSPPWADHLVQVVAFQWVRRHGYHGRAFADVAVDTMTPAFHSANIRHFTDRGHGGGHEWGFLFCRAVAWAGGFPLPFTCATRRCSYHLRLGHARTASIQLLLPLPFSSGPARPTPTRVHAPHAPLYACCAFAPTRVHPIRPLPAVSPIRMAC